MESRLELRPLSLLREACREDGVFSVIGHGIPSCLFDDLQELVSNFFDLPSEVKRKCLRSTSFGRNKQVEYKETAHGESLRINSTPTALYKEEWPTHPSILSTIIAEYLQEHLDLYKSLMTLVRGSLGVAENSEPLNTTSDPITSMTICYYYSSSPYSMFPKFDEGRLSGIATMTFLCGSKGLQIFSKGQWLNVNCNTKAILVSVGDQLGVLSGGEYKRGVHRIFTSNSSRDMLIHVCFSVPEEFTSDLEPFPFVSSFLEPVPVVSSDLEQDAIVPIYLEPIPQLVSSKMEPGAFMASELI